MSTFKVDTHNLKDLQGRVGGLCEDLSGMNRMAPSYQDQIGGHGLEGEVTNFLDAWHTGITLIGGDMLKVSDRLGAAAEAYDQSEGFIGGAAGD